MSSPQTRLYTVSCILLMAGLSLIAYIWWGMSLVTIVFIVIGLACLLPILYTWLTSQRINEELEKELKIRGSNCSDKKTGNAQ